MAFERQHGTNQPSLFLPEEDEMQFLDLLHAFEQEYEPRSFTESILVRELATAEWRLHRIRRVSNTVSLPLSYEMQIRRSFYDALKVLDRIRKSQVPKAKCQNKPNLHIMERPERLDTPSAEPAPGDNASDFWILKLPRSPVLN